MSYHIQLEEWRVVPDFPDYSVSNFGRVKNDNTDKILKPGYIGRCDLAHGGYYIAVALTKDGRVHTRAIHRLVAKSFLPLSSIENPQVRHLNGVPTDNRAENLAWGNAVENCVDRRAHGRETGAKITAEIAENIRASCKSGTTRRDLAERYGLSISQIGRIVTGARWGRL